MEGKKAGKVHACGGGEGLDAEAIEAVGERREGKGVGAGAANHLHTRWGVMQAGGTYGCRPLAQPGEHILPSEGNSERCRKRNQLSKTAIY